MEKYAGNLPAKRKVVRKRPKTLADLAARQTTPVKASGRIAKVARQPTSLGPVRFVKPVDTGNPHLQFTGSPAQQQAALKKALSEGARQRQARADRHAVVTAPAVKVLNETLRPLRASAGAVDAIVQGHPERAPKAVKAGLIDNKGPTYGTVLRHAGVPKGAAAAAGFALDVGLDPTTYVTFGAAVPAKAVARATAIKVTSSELAKGASRTAADRAGRAAAGKVLSDPKLQNKGLTIGARAKVPFATKPVFAVSSSGRGTAAVSRATGVSKVARKVRESGPVQRFGPELVHDFRPAGVTPAQHERVRAAQRGLRAQTAKARRETDREVQALRRAIPNLATSQRIIDHIESGRPLKELGALAPVARDVRRLTGQTFDIKRAHDLLQLPYRPGRVKAPDGTLTTDPLLALTDAQRYLPRVRRMDLQPGRKGIVRRKVGVTKVAPELQRTLREPLAVIRDEKPHLFSEDLPATLGQHRLVAKERAAVADFWGKVAKSGRPLNAQTAKNIDLSHEMVFERTSRGLEPLVKEGGEKLDIPRLQKALDGPAGTHVVLDQANYERLAHGLTDNRTEAGKAFDAVQGRWKTLVTVPMLSYHERNLYGDTMNAYLADTTANAFSKAGKVLGSRVTRNRAQRRTLHPVDTSPSITIAGKQMTHRQLLDEAERHGAIDQGFIARELPVEAQRSAGRVSRAVQYREDLPRLATYISARERGLKASDAADWANKHHFDYGDLTATERAVRRGIPFYTFFARNTRLQATKVLTRPGKQATLGKALDEAAQLAGFKDYGTYVGQLPDNQQRGLPVPVKTDKGVTSWIFNPPTTDLNALSSSPGDLAQNIAQRLTAAKVVAELYANYSIFFQGPIEQPGRKLVPAPTVLGDLPPAIRSKLGVAQYRDKRRGLIWGWPAKVDYIARQLPETNLIAQQLTPVPGSRGQTAAQSRIGVLTGAKPTTYAAAVQDEQIRRESNKLHDLTQARDNLLRTPAAAGSDGYASPKLVRLRAQIKTQDAKVTQLRTKRGDDTTIRALQASPDVLLQQRFDEFSNDPGAAARKLQERFDRFLQKGGG